MIIGGVVVLLLILSMFLQVLTNRPKSDSEWQNDTDGEIPTTQAIDRHARIAA